MRNWLSVLMEETATKLVPEGLDKYFEEQPYSDIPMSRQSSVKYSQPNESVCITMQNYACSCVYVRVCACMCVYVCPDITAIGMQFYYFCLDCPRVQKQLLQTH